MVFFLFYSYQKEYKTPSPAFLSSAEYFSTPLFKKHTDKLSRINLFIHGEGVYLNFLKVPSAGSLMASRFCLIMI